MTAQPFANRFEAGAELAGRLRHYADRRDVGILALPRGGVPVGAAVAEALRVPLDVFLVRKLGVPGHRELAMGALASGGTRVINEDVVRYYGISPHVIDAVTFEEQAELERGERAFRENRPSPRIAGKVIILIDDGLATGSTMRAAVQAVQQLDPARVVVAVPVGAADACRDLQKLADEVVCERIPEPFSAVGQWYLDFSQITDEQVRELLRAHATAPSRS